MCAIAGFIGGKLDDTARILSTMRRRGPDGKGVYNGQCCTLLHSRLSIIDPEGGKQPMTAASPEECYTIVYNGELYNTAQLRKELQTAGVTFESYSDTEVVLKGYMTWGEEVLNRLNGIYAFAIWEEREKRLFLARDRIGVKPLFYCVKNDKLIFASEIKTILAFPGVRAVADKESIYELILLGPGRTPGCGVFRDIRELENGCCAYFEDGKLAVKRYWKLEDREHTDSFAQTADKVRHLVEDAVRSQMVSDVPVGTFLSGGLDSSLITAICADEMKKRGQILPTFSVDYENNDRYFVPNKFQPNSDPHYIRAMLNACQTDHHWCILTAQDLADELENGVEARDLPGMADVDLSLLAFCRQIRKTVTVALSGECADEIFGGYPWFRDKEVRETDGFPWAQNSALRCHLLPRYLQNREEGEAYIRARYEDTIRQCDILPGTSPLEKRMKEMMNLNFRWFMQTLLDRKDRMSMYSSLEVRVPFCDFRIAEYLYAVPWEMKDYRGTEKGLLRYAMRGWLPEEVAMRKKSPYPKTFDPQYLNIMLGRINEVLQSREDPLFQVVDYDAVQEIAREDAAWPWYGQLMRRPQLLCYLLQIRAWLIQYHVEIAV